MDGEQPESFAELRRSLSSELCGIVPTSRPAGHSAALWTAHRICKWDGGIFFSSEAQEYICGTEFTTRLDRLNQDLRGVEGRQAMDLVSESIFNDSTSKSGQD